MRQNYKSLRGSLFTLVSCLSIQAYACMDTGSVYLGTVCMTANTFCPSGYQEAKGQLLPVSSNTALFSLMGAVYGGDGQTTFALPDLQSRTPVGLGLGAGLSPIIAGQKRGVESVIQTITQMPIHTHIANFTPSGGSSVSVTLNAKQAVGQNNPQQGFMLGSGGTGPASATIYVDRSAPGATVSLGGVTVSGGSGGGTVSVATAGASQPTPTITPQIGVRFCVAVQGLYPSRP